MKRARPPDRLAALPRVGSLYLEWSNRFEMRSVRIAALVLAAALILAVSFLWRERQTVYEWLLRMQRHGLATGLVAGIAAAGFVSHRRKVHAARAARSWLGALPMTARVRRIEALTLQWGPVAGAMLLTSVLALLAGATLVAAGLPANPCIAAWRSLELGMLAGACGGLIVPHAKPVTPYPGSRYVPHRALSGRRPVPSLAGLSSWPIRRLFAMLQPKTLSRTLLPVLIMMPLGTSAAEAMVWIGLFGACMTFCFLIVSLGQVFRAARRWLAPLPLSTPRLVHAVSRRAVIGLATIGAVAAWLRWVGRL